MRKLVIATAMTTLIALGVAGAIKRSAPAALAATATPSITISIDEMHRKLDPTSLPVLYVKEPY
jgi:hypothetical protein